MPWDIRRANGFSWTEREGADSSDYEPVFDPAFNFVAVLGGHRQITDPGRYLGDLIDHFVSKGGLLRLEEVAEIAHENGQVTGVRTTSDFLSELLRLDVE